MKKLMILLFALMSFAAFGESQVKLAEVSRFDGRAIGYAGTASPNYEAFRAELARGEAAAPLFEELLKSGPPAAKLYAALGLYRLDQSRGVQALESLRNDTTPVSGMSGCLMEQSTVGKMAAELLKDNAAAAQSYLPR